MVTRRIDTSKFKGHTPGPWHWEAQRWGFSTLRGPGVRVNCGGGHNNQDYWLIADAPDLLAEVERLRGTLNSIMEMATLETLSAKGFENPRLLAEEVDALARNALTFERLEESNE